MKAWKNFTAALFSLLFISLVLIFQTGCSKNAYSNPTSPTNSSPGPNQVWMENTTYVPASLTVAKGTKVTWTNKDSYDHTVTSGTPGHPSGLFDSGNIGSGGTFSYTFDSTGTYQYYCKIHLDKMQGTVTVQ